MLRFKTKAGILLITGMLLTLAFGGLFTVWAQDDVIPLPGIDSGTSEPDRLTVLQDLLGLFHAAPGVENRTVLPAINTASRMFSEVQQLIQPLPMTQDTFGYDISRDGSLVAISIPGRSAFVRGVYLFQQSGAGTWGSPVLVTAADLLADDTFGYSVVLRGDMLFASAPRQNNKGVVYIFKRDGGGTWVQTQKIAPAVPDASLFGTDIRLDASGERMVIGAGAEGTAYIYRKDNNGVWQHETKLIVGNTVSSAAIRGDTVLIGSYDEAVAGSVQVYRLNSGSWTAAGTLSPSDSHVGDLFGGRVYVNGSHAFILGDGDNTGAIYMFEEVGGNWVQRQKLVPLDGGALDQFGISLAVEENTMVIGAHGNEDYLGSVYIFGWNGTAWTQQAKIPAVGGQFGFSSDLTDGELLVSAPGTNDYTGKVFFYRVQAVELLTDGGFESSAAGWTVKNATKDKVKCNKTGKTFSYSGNCAWQFKGVEGENAKIQQTIVNAQAGDTLTLSGYVNAKGAVSSRIKVVVKYTDPAASKNKITVNVSSATGGAYVPLSSIQPILTTDVTSTLDKIKVTVKNSGSSGKVYFDDLSLTAQ